MSEKKKKKLMCFECLPAKAWNKHRSYRGVIIHERVDCPPDQIYFLKEDLFKVEKASK